jgi:protocatechuate 3,4-dioxygenase beta subunit
MKKYAIYIALCTLLGHDALAGERVYKNKLNTCTPTRATINNYEPLKFQPSNNLLHKAGGTPLFCGEKIVLKGKLLDVNCVPVSDAKVYMWQAGCDGKYPYKPLRQRVDHSHINLTSGSSFQGSGTATSDNNGEFQFITIRPSHGNMINLRADHMHLGTLQTSFIPQETREYEHNNNEVYDFVIVMDKANLHRRY